MKVETFNLQNNIFENDKKWLKRMESAIMLIKDHDLDIIGIQELGEKSKKYFEENLKDYSIIGGNRDSKKSDEYNSILIKKNIKIIGDGKTYALSHNINKKASKLLLDFFPRIATTVHIKYDKVKYLIVNTHLDNIFSHNRKVQLKILSKIILEEKHNDEKLIVMGDFNTKTNKKVKDFMFDNNLKEAMLLPNQSSYRVIKFKNSIDHIFVSKGIVLENTSLIKDKYNDVYPSDHYPVITNILTK